MCNLYYITILSIQKHYHYNIDKILQVMTVKPLKWGGLVQVRWVLLCQHHFCHGHCIWCNEYFWPLPMSIIPTGCPMLLVLYLTKLNKWQHCSCLEIRTMSAGLHYDLNHKKQNERNWKIMVNVCQLYNSINDTCL